MGRRPKDWQPPTSSERRRDLWLVWERSVIALSEALGISPIEADHMLRRNRG